MSAADSLILADVVELLGGGVISAHPLCPGAQITLQGIDFGAPQPQTEIVASLLLDGERPSGRRASNRTISLPIQIRGPSRPIMDGARELLQQLVDADTWRLTWTPDPQGGTPLPLIFDCFRATAVTNRDLLLEDSLVSQLTLTFPALPFGRSDTLTTLAFPAPSLSWTPPPLPVRLDDYSSVSSSTQGGWWSQSTQHLYDSYSAHWSWAASDKISPARYTHTLGSPLDITGLGKLSFSLGLGTSNWNAWHAGNVTVSLTLTDNAAHTLSFGGTVYMVASNQTGVPNWNQAVFAIPVSASFDYTHVASYSVRVYRKIDTSGHQIMDADTYLNALTAVSAATSPVPVVRGNVFQLGDPGGTARAPASTQFQSPPQTAVTTQSWTSPGVFSWTVPAGVTAVKVRGKGGSGKGGNRTTAGAGGGGGGGAGAGDDAYPVTQGQVITFQVGTGGTAGGYPVLAASYVAQRVAQDNQSLVTPSFTPATGEVIVIKAVDSETDQNFGSPSGGGLSWTSRASQSPAGHCRNGVWSAVVGAGGTPMTVTLPFSGTGRYHEMVVERWQNAKLAGTPASVSANGSGAPSGTCTTVAPFSIVTWCNSDNNIVDPSGRAYRGSVTEEHVVSIGTNAYTTYHAYQQAASAGAQTVGLSAPGGQAWNLTGIEIQAANTDALTDGQQTLWDMGVGGALAGIAADGGKSVPANVATGGAGGLTANCVGAVTYAGGNGFTGSTTGGGGGSSAGDDLAGVNATSLTGATAPAGGGNGGNGGAAGGNNAGVQGTAPAGAGGGAFSTGGSVLGANGQPGKIQIWYTPPLSPFKTLAVHCPSYMAPPTLNPLMPAGDGQDAPDGREYAITSPVAGLNARFYGTYTIAVFFSTINSPASSRTVTVTFRQYDYPGGPSASRAVTRTLTPNTESPVITNGYVCIGEVTLPVRDIASDNTSAYTTVAVNSTNSSDRALDVLALDVRGQTAIINSSTGHVNYYLDAPSVDRDWGRVLASDYDRPQAASVLDANDLVLSGGPLIIDPAGAGWMLAYSADAGAPAVSATFYSCWRDSRLS